MSFLSEFLHVVVLSIPGMMFLGLLCGSLLNVVIHRSPRIVERQSWEEAAALVCSPEAWDLAFGMSPKPAALELFAEELDRKLDTSPVHSLWHPPSACPKCARPIRWYENVPVASWLWLRARCAGCGLPIAARYPLVELAVMLLFGAVAYRLGPHASALGWAVFAAAMVALGLIDLDTRLLPDRLTLGLLWAGLLAAVVGWTVPVALAVVGAAVGYCATVALDGLCRLLLGKPAFAPGDAKMMAAIGAWLGYPLVVGAALVLAILLGGLTAAVKTLRGRSGPMPFGPYLAASGLCLALVGPVLAYDSLR
jgi:leader peptidase (prepilin peptidase)/N-methyltransferase